MPKINVEVLYMDKPVLRDDKHGGVICYIKEYLIEDYFAEEYDKELFDEIKKICKEFESIYSIKFYLKKNPDTLKNMKAEDAERKELLKELKKEEMKNN